MTAEVETRLQTIREDVMSRTRLTDLIARLELYPRAAAEGAARRDRRAACAVTFSSSSKASNPP